MSLIKRNHSREITIKTHTNPYAHGSVIINCGNTSVHVTACVEEDIPRWLKQKGHGWVTAEYAMLPSSTHERIRRERKGVSGRSQEIQRLIGRSLRACVDLDKLGPRSIHVDCDVLVADGGTRTTSITGAYVALALCINKLIEEGKITESPLIEGLAAISIGINKEGKVIADLNYEEDSSCETDMNIVMTQSGKFVEVQGTAEGHPFSHEQLMALLDCAKQTLEPIFEIQEKAIKS